MCVFEVCDCGCVAFVWAQLCLRRGGAGASACARLQTSPLSPSRLSPSPRNTHPQKHGFPVEQIVRQSLLDAAEERARHAALVKASESNSNMAASAASAEQVWWMCACVCVHSCTHAYVDLAIPSGTWPTRLGCDCVPSVLLTYMRASAGMSLWKKVPPLHLGPIPLGRGVIPLKNKRMPPLEPCRLRSLCAGKRARLQTWRRRMWCQLGPQPRPCSCSPTLTAR